jgi:hypothetical protein
MAFWYCQYYFFPALGTGRQMGCFNYAQGLCGAWVILIMHKAYAGGNLNFQRVIFYRFHGRAWVILIMHKDRLWAPLLKILVKYMSCLVEL